MKIGNKGQSDVNAFLGTVILILGSLLMSIWGIGEILPNSTLITIAKWGIGLLVITVEIVQAIIRGGFR